MILAVRTDKPEAELYLYKDGKEEVSLIWHAHRELSADIHKKISELLKLRGTSYKALKGLVIYKGPGSFTGLRIGFSVANTIAREIDVPIVGASGEDWIGQGLNLIKQSPESRTVLPEYGSEANITKPKK